MSRTVNARTVERLEELADELSARIALGCDELVSQRDELYRRAARLRTDSWQRRNLKRLARAGFAVE